MESNLNCNSEAREEAAPVPMLDAKAREPRHPVTKEGTGNYLNQLKMAGG